MIPAREIFRLLQTITGRRMQDQLKIIKKMLPFIISAACMLISLMPAWAAEDTAGKDTAADDTLADDTAAVCTRILAGEILPLGQSFTADLDADGTPEDVRLYYDDEAETFTWNDITYAYGLYHLQVNDAATSAYGETITPDLYGISPDGETILVIVFQEGPSDDPVCTFYRYKQGTLEQAGEIEDHVTDLTLSEDKVIHSHIRCNIVDTARVKVEWKQGEDGCIREIPKEQYEMLSYGSGREHYPYYAYLRKSLFVFEEPTYGSKLSELEPQYVCFPLTDREMWVYISCEDGTGGWTDMGNWTYEDRNVFFEGLIYAD